ncbi:MAG: SDR family NAD(P)-dependent oxidoreductase [Verrucomicrobia bacterium]|nr:SDR family NAD(P)-dependent oxidoreductase [Verrucomicrobiota bacterium]
MSPAPFRPVAITGLSAFFPQARNLDEFWRLILSGRDCMQDVPATHWLVEDYFDADPKAPVKTYSRHGAFLSDVPFDPVAYGLPPHLLPATDIAQLLALLLARQVLEDCSGGQFARLKLERTSVILGVASATELISSMSGLLSRPMWIEGMRQAGIPEPQVQEAVRRITALFPEWNENTFPGCLGNVVAGRVANRFNLGGTNCVTDAACASSLAALHRGLSELQLGTSDRVITGGVDALNTIFMYMCFSKTPAMSASGHCRPFAASADGTMMGEGGGMLALRLLEDAERDGDPIYAVIRGLGSSSDGRSKSVYAPRPEGQTLALERCYAQAGYSPATVRLVEGHGTGTAAGDLCEASALNEVFRAADRERQQWCALGSIKSQIGHTKGAAGTAGLLKAALALHHRVLPPTANVDAPHPELGFAGSPLYLNTQVRPWIQAASEARRAAVSSFGFGGTNFHVTLEEYRGAHAAPRVRALGVEVLLASAPTAGELARKIGAWLKLGAGDLPRVAEQIRADFDPSAPWRVAIIASSADEVARKAGRVQTELTGHAGGGAGGALAEGIFLARGSAAVDPASVVFLFPGQGSQSVGMAAELPMNFAPALAVWEEIEELALLGRERLCDLVYPPPATNDAEKQRQEEKLRTTEVAQPALATVSLAYLSVLDAAGVKPALVGGHSLGEVVALQAAGALTRADCVRVCRRRGELMAAQAQAAGQGSAMTAVRAPREKIAELLRDFPACVLANHNSPEQCVVAGPSAELDRLEAKLGQADVSFRRLAVAAAFHSAAVAGAAAPFAEFLAEVKISALARPVFNNGSAAPYQGRPDEIRAMLARQLAEPVQFVDQLRAMQAAGGRIFVEVGAGTVLSALVRQTLGDSVTAIPLNPGGQSADAGLLQALARLAVAGVRLDWNFLRSGYRALLPEPKLSAAALPVGGYNLGRPYPPRDGQRTPPVPVPAPAPLAPAPAARVMLPPTSPSVMSDHPTATSTGAAPARSPGTTEAITRAHEAYLRALSDAHRAFLAAMSGQAVPPSAASTTMPVAKPALPPAPPPVPVGAQAVPAPPREPARSKPVAELPAARAVAVATPPPPVTEEKVGVVDGASVIETVLQTVAEKTGYPRDMLEPAMQLEGDLGIDSIKRVEILAAVQKKLPGLPTVDAKVMGSLQTLEAISNYLRDQLGASVAKAPPASAAATRVTVPAAPTAASAPSAAGIMTVILETVADKTGYPRDMLEPHMQLEGDLGIDSIKRVEILAAVQKKLPGLPPVDAKIMAGLETLQAISDHLAQQLGGGSDATALPAPDVSAATAAAAGPAPARVEGLRRYRVTCEPAAPTIFSAPILHRARRLVITEDGRGIARALCDALHSQRVRAEVVTEIPTDCDGVILMHGLHPDPALAAARGKLQAAFLAARSVAPSMAQSGGLLVTVQDTGGRFGMAPGPGGRAWYGGLAGLAKTAGKEWPQAVVRAIDLECGTLSAQELGRRLAAELLFGGDEREVGLPADGSRHRLITTEASALVAAPARLTSRSVVIATGGARGVTAEALIALAKARHPRFVLLGRTELGDEPAECRGVTHEADLRRVLLTREQQAGRHPTPREAAAAAREILARREISATLARLRSAGSEAEYVACDATDAVAVNAVLARVRQSHGGIHALVHGAGVLADKLIAEKTPEEFARVFDTKVKSLQALLAATADDALEAIVLFSSVAGRFGNRGQVDYAMANEVLNKVAAAEAQRRGDRCVVRSINWGPWEGGMVTPALREHFQQQGVGLIPLLAGAEAFVAELTNSATADGAEIVIGVGQLDLAAAAAPGRRVEVLVTAERYPFLSDHVVKGKQVVPIALVTEWLLEAAALARPEATFRRLRDVQVLAPVVLNSAAERRVLQITAALAADGTVGLRIVEADSGKLHYSALADANTAVAVPPTQRPAEANGWRDFGFEPADAYRGRLFHGRDLQVIRELRGWTQAGAALVLENHPLAAPGANAWRVGPAVLDGALQAAVLWSMEAHGRKSLPLRIGELVLHRPARPGETLACHLQGKEVAGPGTESNVECIDADGGAVFSLRGVECYQVDSFV